MKLFHYLRLAREDQRATDYPGCCRGVMNCRSTVCGCSNESQPNIWFLIARIRYHMEREATMGKRRHDNLNLNAMWLVQQMGLDNGCAFTANAEQAEALNNLAHSPGIMALTLEECDTLCSGSDHEQLALMAKPGVQALMEVLTAIFENGADT